MKTQKDFSLKKHNSLKVDAYAKEFVEIQAQSDIQELVKHPKIKSGDFYVLGAGCNTLFTSDFDGLVVHVALKGRELLKEDKNHAWVKVAAGEDWHEFVTWAVENNWGGVENLALIPGSVGASPVQNIAAFGQEFSDKFVELEAVNLATADLEVFDLKACKFSYRESTFKQELNGKYIITSVTMRLDKNPKVNADYWSQKHSSFREELAKIGAKSPYTIKDLYDVVVSYRTRKFPDLKEIGCAGSFFKNPAVSREKYAEIKKRIPTLQYYPIEGLQYTENTTPDKMKEEYVKIAAGMLIDQGLNWLGKKEGKVGIYETHGLLIVTEDGVKPEDVKKFTQKIVDKIQEEFGIRLEYEVRNVC